MKTYTVLYAQDVPHYCTHKIHAANDAKALRKAMKYPATHNLIFEDPAWDSPVLLRIVHIEDEKGGIVAADIELDDFRLSRASDSQACDTRLAGTLRTLRDAIAGLPITILNGPLYDALHAADRELARAQGDAA